VNLNDTKGNLIASGKQSQVVVLDRRSDSREANVNTLINYVLNERVTMQGGGLYQYYVGKNFQTVDDLLGGDFYINWDRFAERDNPGNETVRQFDVENPNRAVKAGERFGNDYNENIRIGTAWVQFQGVLPKVDYFVAGNIGQTSMWRHGNVRNGRFSDNSLGKGATQNFTTFGGKGGLTFKMTGAHYFYANGAYIERAPKFRDIYIAPRVRDGVAAGIGNEKITTGEIGYLLRLPYWKGRLTGFYNTIENQTTQRQLFFPNRNTFGTQTLTGINQQFMGIEAGLESRLTSAMTVILAGSAGDYFYTNNPNLTISADNSGELVLDGTKTYLKNFRVRGPHTAATATVRYQLPKFAFINLSANWVDKIYYDIDPTRRTSDYLAVFDNYPDTRLAAIQQTNAKSAWTLDFFGGKSWKINQNFLYLNIGISNITNNKYINSGWENPPVGSTIDPVDISDVTNLSALGLRTKSNYAFGTTWFASVTWRM
jgi:hypothetical protein